MCADQPGTGGASATVDDGTTGDDEETPLEQVAAGVAVGVTLLVAFGLLALGFPWFWVAFPVGFGGFLPASVGLARWYESREASSPEPDRAPSKSDALDVLRRRYAEGELTEDQFEERVERLLETETIEGARDLVGSPSSADGPDDRERLDETA